MFIGALCTHAVIVLQVTERSFIFSVSNGNTRTEPGGKLLKTRWMEQTSWEEEEKEEWGKEKWERKDRSLMALCVFPHFPTPPAALPSAATLSDEAAGV
ncbi:uncharacterized [Tachysurus ichikawai]